MSTNDVYNPYVAPQTQSFVPETPSALTARYAVVFVLTAVVVCVVMVPVTLLAEYFPLQFSKPETPFTGLGTLVFLMAGMSFLVSRRCQRRGALLISLAQNVIGWTVYIFVIILISANGLRRDELWLVIGIGVASVVISLVVAAVFGERRSVPHQTHGPNG